MRAAWRLTVPICLDLGNFVADPTGRNFPTSRTFSAAAEPAQRVARDSEDFSGGPLRYEAIGSAVKDVRHAATSSKGDQCRNTREQHN
jgi:hypothetical protein